MDSSLALTSSSLKKRLLLGGGWALGGRVVTAITELAINVLLVRLLTPEEMGAYFLTFTLVSVAAMLGQMGLGETMVRLIAESVGAGKPGRARASVHMIFLYGGLAILVVAGILALGAGQWLARHVFDSSLIAGVINLAAAWIVVFAFQGLLAEAFRGFQDIRLAIIFGGLVKSVISVVSFALLWILQGHANLGQVLTLSIVAVGISDLSAGFSLYRKVNTLKGEGQLPSKEVLAIAWPLLINRLMVFVLDRADILILGALRPQDEVAFYGTAARLVRLITTPLLIAQAVVPPFIAEMYTQGKKKELERTLRTVATLAGIPALITLVGFALVGESILGLVFGDFYRKGAVVLVLLSVGQLVNVWTGPCAPTLKMTNHQVTMMKISLFYGFLSIAGAMLLASDYGALGVACVTALVVALQNVSTLLLTKRKTGMWTHMRSALPPFDKLHGLIQSLIRMITD